MSRRAKMHERNEKRRPSARSLGIVDAAIAEISAGVNEGASTRISQYGRNHRIRFAFDLDYTTDYCSAGAKILDCGAWPFLSTLAHVKSGYAVSAIDANASRVGAFVKDLGFDLVDGNIEQGSLPYEENTFDAILFNEVFEHMRIDLIATMREIYRILKPGATLFLSTPNIRSARGLYNLIVRDLCYSSTPSVYDQFEKLHVLGHMGHVREYTKTELSEFLTRVGFVPYAVIWRGNVQRRLMPLQMISSKLRPRFSLIVRKPSGVVR